MAAISLCEAPLAHLKKRLMDEFVEVKSSHLTEALASSMGFRTHAALKAAMTGPEEDRPFYLLDPEQFLTRLTQFGYPLDPKDPEFDFDLWHDQYGVTKTMPTSGYDIEYKTPRERAWRNLMVCGVNAALEQKLFTLRPGDDRFDDNMRSGHLFDFVLPNGLPARGSIADAGFDELAVHVAVNPKGDRVRYFEAGFTAGDVFGTTWLERRNGAWLQSTTNGFRCRKPFLEQLAELDVKPQGFGDRGKLIM
ncbi:hypothetical protein [Pelomonas sp. Root1444]|jgi:hypothetical protein|uniref:hypothetical protein n=1 Tax=Pelomonas sp. Root1444 TaxID=1736464 RepID=UPI000702D51E|nr:hypothetical protein [Pelomonas sp. Root1444]KQY80922.1 hypothetical protein ASD35_03485 [Pelomonas sp. Root1444]